MKGLVADNNVAGQLERLLDLIRHSEFADYFLQLVLTVETMETLGFSPDVIDRILWTRCQEREMVLITAQSEPKGGRFPRIRDPVWRSGFLPGRDVRGMRTES